MQQQNTADYYHRRETQERQLADRATSPAIARIHRELADRYQDMTGERGGRASMDGAGV